MEGGLLYAYSSVLVFLVGSRVECAALHPTVEIFSAAFHPRIVEISSPTFFCVVKSCIQPAFSEFAFYSWRAA